ncbi:MAG: acyl--CoA ligase [Chitinispirillales bacterium]|jgi:acyl-CoA synthetase (AMP-forming)/AMP-acid ligase II|nr:acyl--CoA ligase [Chitinispirillales bacterium]
MLLKDIISGSALRCGQHEAVWFKGESILYTDLDKRSDDLAWSLIGCGIKKGERVALLYENSIDYVIAFFAITKAGAVIVPLSSEASPEEAGYLINHCEAAALIIQKRYVSRLSRVFDNCVSLKFIVCDEKPDFESCNLPVYTFGQLPPQNHIGPPPRSAIDIDLACIVYTSGSTGRPKGVMLSHLNIISNTRSIAGYLNLTEKDRILAVLPFSYVYGTTLLLTHIYCGGTVLIDNGFSYPNCVLENMVKLNATGFAGVPSTYMILLSRSTLANMKFPRLRYVTQAGGSMPADIQKQVVKAFRPAQLFVMYGATELSPRLTYVPPEDLKRKWGSIGIPIPNCEAYAADCSGKRLPPFTEGEIVGRGSNVMMGYWKDPQMTANVLRGGVYFTGDRGYTDEDGFLYVSGRKDEMLKVGGKKVSAREIEDAVASLGCVQEAAVIGVSHPVLGQAAKAFVVLKPTFSHIEDEIKTMLDKKLPRYKLPSQISIVSNLPKNASGKVMRKELERM